MGDTREVFCPSFVYCPDGGHVQEIVDLINTHDLPVLLIPEGFAQTELRISHGESVVGAPRILAHLKEQFASSIAQGA